MARRIMEVADGMNLKMKVCKEGRNLGIDLLLRMTSLMHVYDLLDA